MRKKILGVCVVVFIINVLLTCSVMGCTGFFIKANDGGIAYSRSLEFAITLKSTLAVFPRNLKFKGVTPKGENGIEWKAKYGFIGMNVFGKPFIIDGLNEKGLLFGAFYFPDVFYLPEYDTEKAAKSLSNMQVGVWALSNFATVEDVRESLSKINIVPTVLKGLGICPPLHYLILDATGDCIVIEPTKEGIQVYNNPVNVITNSPSFDWHLNNLRQYMKLTNRNLQSLQLGKLKLTPIGSGSGMFGIPGDITPPSRFVRAAFYVNQLPEQKNVTEAINTGIRLLKYFYITKGMVVEQNGEASSDEYTVWETHADLKNRRYFYATYENINIRMVDLNKLNFDGARMLQFDINQPQKFTDVTNLIK